MTASIKFTGDFAVLDEWIDQLRAAQGSMRVISANLAEETIELIREGFETSTDPYGKPWAALQLRAGRPLEDTGGLKASWHRRFVTDEGFVVQSGKEYARYHQAGTGIYGPRKQPIVPKQAKALRIPGPLGVMFRASVDGSPPRKMVPDKGELPSKWRDRYVEVAQEVMTELFR